MPEYAKEFFFLRMIVDSCKTDYINQVYIDSKSFLTQGRKKALCIFLRIDSVNIGRVRYVLPFLAVGDRFCCSMANNSNAITPELDSQRQLTSPFCQNHVGFCCALIVSNEWEMMEHRSELLRRVGWSTIGRMKRQNSHISASPLGIESSGLNNGCLYIPFRRHLFAQRLGKTFHGLEMHLFNDCRDHNVI